MTLIEIKKQFYFNLVDKHVVTDTFRNLYKNQMQALIDTFTPAREAQNNAKINKIFHGQ